MRSVKIVEADACTTCPSQPRAAAAIRARFKGQNVSEKVRGWWQFSYGMSRDNFSLNWTPTSAYRGTKMGTIKNPSSKVAYGENFSRSDYKCTGADQPGDNGLGYYWMVSYLTGDTYQGGMASRHSGMTNVLWSDWHVSTVKREQVWSVAKDDDIFNNFWNIKY